MKFQKAYRGIVIQNNDPKHSGRIKVYVPGINITQLKNWNQKLEEDKFFKNLGENTNTSLTLDILQDQKNKLFWATVVMPVAGSGTAGIYNAPGNYNIIGNDSGYIFQNGNKTDEFFKKDEKDFKKRENTDIKNPSYGINPYTQINLNFSFSGKRYCVKNSCNIDTIPSFWSNYNGPLNEIIDELPKTYIDDNVVLDDIDSNTNTGIIGAIIDVFDPTIYYNDKELPKDSPLYNTDCYISVKDKNIIRFSPPIFYEEIDEKTSSDYNDVPIQIAVNGKLSTTDNFKLDYSDSEKVVYKKDNLKISVPINNINAITIKHNKNKFDINKVLSLLPLLSSFLNIVGKLIMPRAPYPDGGNQPTRGGGGAAIYSNVSTKLLPTNQRVQSRLKGANNFSKTEINKGRKAENDVNKTLGNNITGPINQAHRGPMTSIDYTNEWKGMMSIPGVGSHVWVTFENGDTNFPFIIGSIANSGDVKGIFQTK